MTYLSLDKIKSKFESKKWFFIVFPILIYILLSASYLGKPGIQYDEILFGNAAVGGIDGSFITKSFHSIPILLMPYIGALKAYIFFPIFKIFGVSVLTLRLPVILITALGIYFLYRTFKETSMKLALLVAAIFATTPSIILFTRTDVGPNTLEIFLKIISIYCLHSYHRTKQKVYLYILPIFLALGMFNKLNFLWFINALAAFILMYEAYQLFDRYYKERILPQKNVRNIIVTILTFIPFVGYFLLINKTFGLSSSTSISSIVDSIELKLRILRSVVDGTYYSTYVIGKTIKGVNDLYLIFILVILAFGLFALIKIRKEMHYYAKPYFFLVTIIAFTIVQIFYTTQATAPWHALAVEPMLSILIGMSLFFIWKYISIYINKKSAVAITIGIVILILLHTALLFSRYFKAFSEDVFKPMWSTEIYELIDYTNNIEGLFYSVDWGLHNQLITFNQDDIKFEEITWLLNDGVSEPEGKYLLEQFKNANTDIYFITRPEEIGIFDNTNDELFKFIKLNNELSLDIDRKFEDSRGSTQYIIYRLKNI